MTIVFISLCTAFGLVFPFYLISTAIASSPKRREEAKFKAMKQGHVVTAVLKKTGTLVSEVPGVIGQGSCLGIYEYVYKGKRYKYRMWRDNHSPTLKLYFLRNPRKATVDLALVDSTINWPVVYLVVFAIVYLIWRS